jgi:signal transduction histidine kinase
MDKVLDQQTTEIEDLNQLKDDFLNTISHELRSLVTNIKIAAQMLKLLLQQDRNNEDGKSQLLTRQEQTKLKAKVDRKLTIIF